MSQPFFVDQLKPAGLNAFKVPYKDNSRVFPARETGNLKINMAEADLKNCRRRHSLPVRPVSLTIWFSLRIPVKMKTKIYTLKLPVIIIIRPESSLQWCELFLSHFIICSQHRIWTDILLLLRIRIVFNNDCLKYNFNIAFINIYNNVFMSKTFWTILFGGQIFPPSSVNRPVGYFFSEKPFIIYFNYLRTRISAEEWIDSINYLIK